jgi:hypothetical protein
MAFEFPVDALDALSSPARRFLSLFGGSRGVCVDDLLNDAWRANESIVTAYRDLPASARLEVHVLVGFFLHETIHKVDMLISPFGVQYLALLVYEYVACQNLVAECRDTAELQSKLPVLRWLARGQTERMYPETSALPGLDRIVRKSLAWGDIGDLRPSLSDIDPHHLGLPPSGSWFGPHRPVEWVAVMGCFQSLRPAGTGNWYLRPTTILETKAVAGTLLYILDLAPDPAELLAYWRMIYADREGMPQDYFFILDLLASMSGQQDFDTLLEGGIVASIRHVLLLAQGVCWLAMHASPRPIGASGKPSTTGNPVVRLVWALSLLPEALSKLGTPGQPMLGNEILMYVEKHELFSQLDQVEASLAIKASVHALGSIEELAMGIHDEEVRRHFAKVCSIMRPQFLGRRPGYDSLFGQPDTGNPRIGVRTAEQMELFFHDHAPSGAYSEWLGLRGAALFSRSELSAGTLDQIVRHFSRR